jgi:hypothetical protein
MKILPTMAVLAILAFQPAAAEEPHRRLGAHEHGRGTLNIAVEGSKMILELETPGMDIVGFEHAAKSRRDLEAVKKAKAQLMAPLSLFKLPAAAGCRVTDASVEVEIGEHDHGAEKELNAAEGPEGGKGSEKNEPKSAGHTEFHGQYTIECRSAAAVTTIEFGYFLAFAGAEKLDVNVITAKGQGKFEVARANPRIDLAGMI